MQQIYFLSDESKAALTDNIKAIATEAEYSQSYLYKILESEKTDPFQPFRRLYAACVRAGVDTTPYDAALSAIKARYRALNPKSMLECLAEKIDGDSQTTICVMKSIQEGQIDEAARSHIHEFIERERANLEAIEAAMLRNMPLRDFARRAVRR